MRESVLAVLERGHTGRNVHIDDGYAMAKRWAECGNLLTLHLHPGHCRFRSEASAAPRILGDYLNVVRGRGQRTSQQIVGWEEMGPPKPSETRANRYNRAKRPVLYLCDSQAGVQAELATEGSLCIQGYRLPLDQLSIADLANSQLSSFTRAVMDFAEAWDVSGRQWPALPAFSRNVAAIVQAAGFDGMRVPGVRGTSDYHYCNIVMFYPHQKWREWTLGQPAFYRL